MDRKELLVILVLAALVGGAAWFRLYQIPESVSNNRRRRTVYRNNPSLSRERELPRSREARDLLERAEGAFSYAIFATAAGEKDTERVFRDIITQYRTFRELHPNERAAELALLRIAQCYTAQKLHAEASRAYDRVLEVYPNSEVRPMALFWGAHSHLQLGDVEAARARYEEVVDAYPDTSFAREAKRRLSELPPPKSPKPEGSAGPDAPADTVTKAATPR